MITGIYLRLLCKKDINQFMIPRYINILKGQKTRKPGFVCVKKVKMPYHFYAKKGRILLKIRSQLLPLLTYVRMCMEIVFRTLDMFHFCLAQNYNVCEAAAPLCTGCVTRNVARREQSCCRLLSRLDLICGCLVYHTRMIFTFKALAWLFLHSHCFLSPWKKQGKTRKTCKHANA